MWKKRKIDFILNEDEFSKTIFRFYPRQSSCHSFGDEPPNNWNNVYKVYYAYSIIKQYKPDDDNETPVSYVMFEETCDECSVVDEVAVRCKLIYEGTESVTKFWFGEEYTIELLNTEITPFGDGVSWKISNNNTSIYKIEMFDYCGKGFRFWLDKNKLKAFGEYLLECCEYMLAHGDPI